MAGVLVTSGSAFHLGGMERVMQTLGRELPRRGLTVKVIIPDQHLVSQVGGWFRDNGVTVVVSEDLARLVDGDPRGVVAYGRYLRSAGGVVNIHSPGAHVPLKEVLAARLAGLPVITSIHGYEINRRSRAKRRLNARLGSAFNTAVVAMNRTVFTQQLEQGVGARKLQLIYNGVPEVTDPTTRQDARRQLALAEDAFVLTSFGRLVPDKGIDTLVQAVNCLPDDVLSRSRVFVGGVGPDLDMLTCQVAPRAKQAVSFLGHVDNTGLFYAASDLFVLPSRHEPFGLVFLEAAQYALACIGTSVGGIPEIVVDGETGFLVPPERPDELAARIVWLSRDEGLRQDLGKAARRRVQTNFTLDGMVGAYARLFQRTLSSHGSVRQ